MNTCINRFIWMALALGSLVNITGCQPNSDAQLGPRQPQPQMVLATPETRLPAAIADLPAVVQQRIRQLKGGVPATARIAGLGDITGNWELIGARSYPAFEDIPGWTNYAPFISNGWFDDWGYGKRNDPNASLKMQLNPGSPFSSQGTGWFSWIQGSIGAGQPWRYDDFGLYGLVTLGNSGNYAGQLFIIPLSGSTLITVSSTAWSEYVNGVHGVTRIHTDLRIWRRY